ncbi:MAG: hypothetical protein RBR97_16245, partial [Bacteroidales bacterium]|nr:hypothetical protein [Bacteroidales bacterium]
ANNLLTHPVTFGLTITLGRLSIGKGKYFVNCKKNARLIEVKTEVLIVSCASPTVENVNRLRIKIVNLIF